MLVNVSHFKPTLLYPRLLINIESLNGCSPHPMYLIQKPFHLVEQTKNKYLWRSKTAYKDLVSYSNSG